MSRGSEQRQRKDRVTIRLSAQEAAAVRRLAADSGLTPGALLRKTLLDVPAPRHRVPRTDERAVARLLGELATVRGELGKSGSNLNQIAFHLNADRKPDSALSLLENALAEHEEAVRTLLELRTACMQALGREPGRPSESSPTRAVESLFPSFNERAKVSGG